MLWAVANFKASVSARIALQAEEFGWNGRLVPRAVRICNAAARKQGELSEQLRLSA